MVNGPETVTTYVCKRAINRVTKFVWFPPNHITTYSASNNKHVTKFLASWQQEKMRENPSCNEIRCQHGHDQCETYKECQTINEWCGLSNGDTIEMHDVLLSTMMERLELQIPGITWALWNVVTVFLSVFQLHGFQWRQRKRVMCIRALINDDGTCPLRCGIRNV